MLYLAQCKLLQLYCTFTLLITYPDIHFPSIKGSLNLLPYTWTKYHPPLQSSYRAELAWIVSVDQPLWWLTALPPQNGCANMSFNPKLWFALFTKHLSPPFQGKQTTTQMRQTAYITNINLPFRLIDVYPDVWCVLAHLEVCYLHISW